MQGVCSKRELMIVLGESNSAPVDTLIYNLLENWWDEKQHVTYTSPTNTANNRRILTTAEVQPNEFFDTYAKATKTK